MIIIGDLAVPSKEHLVTIEAAFKKININENKSMIVNLEGLLSSDNHINAKEPILYNCTEIVDLLSKYNTKVACLANNHTFDLVDNFDSTIETLENNNILSIGASRNKEKIFEPIKIIDNGVEDFLFNLCWYFLLYNQSYQLKGIYFI